MIGIAMFWNMWPPFGGTVSGERSDRVRKSSSYRDGQFVNTLTHPPMEAGDIWMYLKERFFGGQVRLLRSALPIDVIQPAALGREPALGSRAIWLGHSSVCMELDGLRLLVDPVFSDRASPFTGIGPKRFHPPPIAMKDLPAIDAVLISHDHPDHLDMHTVKYLAEAGTHFYIPLGVGAHLEKWGVPENQVTELDWFESARLENLTINCAPAQHYSGRRIFDYKKTLWASWSFAGSEYKVFYSGDTGYSEHVKQVGDLLGPFDLSIMKIGLYGPGASWIYSHMDPEEAVDAHIALGVQRMLPVHRGTFNIAFQDWDEPVKRALKAADDRDVDLVTPRVGEAVIAGEPFRSQRWWEGVR